MIKEIKPASHGRRIGAFIIDNTISALCAQFLLKTQILPSLPSAHALYAAIGFILVIFPMLYWVLLTLLFGSTPAKKLFKLRIVNFSDGTAPTFRTLFVREVFARFLSGIALGIGYFWAFFNEDRRSWHDLISKTRVVSG